MSFIKRLAAFAVSAIMLFAFCSCNQSATKVIMTIGNTEVPAGIYIMYINSAISELETEIADAEYEGDKWDFEIEGKKAEQWVKDKALQYTLELIAVEREFEKRGLSFDAEEQSNVDYITEYYWYYYSSYYEGLGISYSSFARVQKGSHLSQKILLSQFGEDGTEPISDEDLTKYMSEDYMRVNHILISNKDDEGVKLEVTALDDAKKKAENLFEQAKNADDIYFIQMIKDNSADYNADSTTESSLELGMITPEEESGYVKEFEKAAAELEIGGTVLCESEYGWHIIRRYDMFKDEVVKLDDYREQLVISMKEDDYNAEKETWANALREDMTLVQASVDRYDPKDKKFNAE